MPTSDVFSLFKPGLRGTDVMIGFPTILGPVRYRRISPYFISTEYQSPAFGFL
jgi:hypothetical protein